MLRLRALAVSICACTFASHAEDSAAAAAFRKYCFQCHGNGASTAGIRLDQMLSKPTGENFQAWNRVIAALDQSRMPPKGLPQPADSERHVLSQWIRGSLDAYIKK